MTQSAILLCVDLFGEFALKMRIDRLALSFFLAQMSCSSEPAEPPESSSDGTGGNEGSSGGPGGDEGSGGVGGSGGSFATGGQSVSSSSGGDVESSSGGNDAAGGTDAGGLHPTCSSRTDGGFVTLEICEELLTVWITDDTFLNEAIALQQSGESRIACFPGLFAGPDCDAEHNWHVDPSSAYFTDFELETYFDCPSEVEKNRSHWIEQIGQYCGEHTIVSDVDDRR